MNQRCPHKIDCEGSDSPIANLTSETPEGQYWRAIDYCCNGAIKQYFSNLSYDDAIDGVQRLLVTSCPSCPPTVPDGTDEFYTCDALCADGSASVTASSTLSQDDACFKAQELANQLPCPPVAPPPPYHCNDTQICESINEDGTYTYIILPCTIYGESPAAANAIALSRACQRAKENRIKMGPITRCCCANEVYSSTIKVTSEEATLTYAVIAGSLPPGITVGTGTTTSKTILVSGTPTTAGTYTFSIRAYDNSGNYSTRQYTIAVIEIATTSLPDFTVGTAYSAQLSATGGSGVYAWGIASGTLPDGLTLSTTGLISGTPTALAADSTVVFTVVDTDCEQLEASTIPPRVTLTGASTTRYLHWMGWNAFNGEKRRFKKLAWTGTSEHWATPWGIPTEFLRAKYIWDGTSEITAAGVQISQYTKKLYQRSSEATPQKIGAWLYSDESIGFQPGYCFSADPESKGVCNSTDLTFCGDFSANSTGDVSDLIFGTRYLTSSATDLTVINPITDSWVTPIGHDWHYDQYRIGWYPTPPAGFPTVMVNEVISAWAIFYTDNNYSATLSEEYTDAEALANATVYTGNSLTAENHPRNITSVVQEDWYRANLTSVTYQLHFANLVVGRAYTAEVSLICSNGTTTKPTWTFTAAATTHDITASIPTPPANHTTMVRYAKVAFA